MRVRSSTSTTCSASWTRQQFRPRWERRKLRPPRPNLQRRPRHLLRHPRLLAVRRLPSVNLKQLSHRRRLVALPRIAASTSPLSQEQVVAGADRKPMSWPPRAGLSAPPPLPGPRLPPPPPPPPPGKELPPASVGRARRS